MKITIEGDPKEIAAYELALKDGREAISVAPTFNDILKNRKEILDQISPSAK